MQSITRYVIRQNVKLVNGSNEWVDVFDSFTEMKSDGLLEKYKKTGAEVTLIKITEEVIR